MNLCERALVLFTTHQADIQKNTLQVKVAIRNPPATIRPDMLVQVTFLAPPSPKSDTPKDEPLRLLVSRQAVETGEGGSHVWIADQAAGVAHLRTVKLGATAGDWVKVAEGLNAADRIISGGREGLRDGERITITGEDSAGVVSSGPGTKSAPNRIQRATDGGDAGKQGKK